MPMSQNSVIIKERMLINEASRWVGTLEQGQNKGQLVEMFQKAVDNKAVGEAWCLSFLAYCIKAVDKACKTMAGDIATDSQLAKTEHCMTLWNTSPVSHRSKVPKPGYLMIWQYYKDGKPSSSGHVAVVKNIIDKFKVTTIEGNTSSAGNDVVREGEGVFEKTRFIEGTSTMKVVGFLRPWL